MHWLNAQASSVNKNTIKGELLVIVLVLTELFVPSFSLIIINKKDLMRLKKIVSRTV